MAVDFKVLTVLVVEDEAFSLTVVTKVLQGLGVQNILCAENGQVALDVLEDTRNVDMIITDIEMPELNGFEFARRVRYGQVERFKSVPILMLTGADTEDNIRKGRIHKINAFIVKPPKPEELRDHMLLALG
ncbi:response regulator [Magnetovibrio sp. PR-2]|uniref:response regulator n=1 Tax=Magnetovibrio sp. PR-2 TaxID=3120356 RepID=UPI002FCE4048